MPLGLGTNLSSTGMITPGIVTGSLVLKHNYAGGGVVPVSDGAAYFDGNNGGITSSIPASTFHGDCSVAFWVKRTTIGTTDMLIDCRDLDNDGYQLFFKSANTFQLGLNSNDTTTSTTFTDIGRWYHIAVVQNDTANTQQIYVDGVLNTSGTVDVDLDNANASFTLGCNFDGTSQELIGYMCNVGVWNATLTQPQIKSIMWKNYANLTTGTGSESENLVSWWNLDTETNTSGEAGTGGVKDSHGTYHGTLT